MASEECPVCFETIGVDPASWPCGHRVCRACDARMQSNAMHVCPNCRTPREGYTAESARAASARAGRGSAGQLFFSLQPMAQEYPGMQPRRPSGPALIFFPSEAGGDGPAGILADLEHSVRMPPASPPGRQEDVAEPNEAASEPTGPTEPRDGLNALALLLVELTRPNATVESFQAHARALRHRLRVAAHPEIGNRSRRQRPDGLH